MSVLMVEMMHRMSVLAINAVLLLLVIGSVSASAEEAQMLKVTGKLMSVVAIGGETTGWAIDLDSPFEVDGESVTRLEVDHDTNRYAKFENQRIEAIGKLVFINGVERGKRRVLEVTEIRQLSSQ
jgi:hypothetical protein